jgi:hypothetical protein
MRTLAVAAITSLIALAIASVASAAPTVSLVWTDCAGPGCGAGIGTSNLVSDVGDVVTLELQVTGDANGLSFAGASLDVSAAGMVTGGTLRAGIDSINDGLGTVFTSVTGMATYGGGGLELVSGVTCPGASALNLLDTLCGLSPFLTASQTGSDLGGGLIGTYAAGPGGPTLAGASIGLAQVTFNVVPEPATGGLLALGLGALAFMGRRRA